MTFYVNFRKRLLMDEEVKRERGQREGERKGRGGKEIEKQHLSCRSTRSKGIKMKTGGGLEGMRERESMRARAHNRGCWSKKKLTCIILNVLRKLKDIF